jgi:hypothetical protein
MTWIRIGLAPWIRILIRIEAKSWIWIRIGIRIETNIWLKESASFPNPQKWIVLSISDSINTTTFYLFSCTFSHLEDFYSELVSVLHFPFISIADPCLF